MLNEFQNTRTRAEQVDNKDGFIASVVIPHTDPASSNYYGIFFQAMFPCEIIKIATSHSNGSVSSTVTVAKYYYNNDDPSGAGSNVSVAMPHDSGTTSGQIVYFFDPLQGVENGVPLKHLDTGDRLGIKLGGDPTNLKYLAVSVYLKPLNKGDYTLYDGR